MRTEKTNESEPLMKSRNVLERRRNRGKVVVPGEVQEARVFCLDDVRLEGGVTLDQAHIWNMGTCRPDVKGDTRAGDPRKGQSTDAGHRGGAVRSRNEGAVMALDRRGCGVQPRSSANRSREELHG